MTQTQAANQTQYARKMPKQLFADEHLNILQELEATLKVKIDMQAHRHDISAKQSEKMFHYGSRLCIIGFVNLVALLFVMSAGFPSIISAGLSVVGFTSTVCGNAFVCLAAKTQYGMMKELVELMNDYKKIRLEQDEAAAKVDYSGSVGEC